MDPVHSRARFNRWDNEFPIVYFLALGVKSANMESGPASITYKEPPKLQVLDICLTVESEHNRVMADRTGQNPGLIIHSDIWGRPAFLPVNPFVQLDLLACRTSGSRFRLQNGVIRNGGYMDHHC